MKTAPIEPAHIEWRADGVPHSPRYGDVYHSRAGARLQAEHVFLAGNGLPERWRGRDRFVILETGFGLGHTFVATLDAWRADERRGGRLWFLSIEKHPPRREDLQRAHGDHALVRAWPPLTPNIHRLDFGDATLLLALGDIAAVLPQVAAEVDAIFLDGFAPPKNPPMWDRRVFKALARLAAPGATAATWSVARDVRDGLAAAGFRVERAAGFGTKREITTARYAPAFVPRRAPARQAARRASDAVVVGAGLAGAATARALAAQGCACTVLEREPQAAMAASGNPGGLYHGIFNVQDGTHARLHRAAALRAAQVYAPLVAQGVAAGQAAGLLRLEAGLDAAGMRRRIDALGLPAGYVQACDGAATTRHAGLPIERPAWFYPGGGWIDPRGLVRHWLGADPRIRFQGNAAVRSLRRAGDRWQVLGADDTVLAEADVVVLANAADAARLGGGAAWPLQSARGQVTRLRGAARPALPFAGAGYALALADGDVLCGGGAEARPGDLDTDARGEDDAHNAAQYARVAGLLPEEYALAGGRAGIRLASDDRLPVVGAVPRPASAGVRLDQPRLVPREDGLYVCTALGSRGLTWAPLLGETLACWITGAPLPLEADLVDAIDVARFIVRDARHLERHSDQPPPSAR